MRLGGRWIRGYSFEIPPATRQTFLSILYGDKNLLPFERKYALENYPMLHFRKLSANHRTRLLSQKYFASDENKKSSVPILYRDLREISFIYFGLKSSIIIKGDFLLTTGRYKIPPIIEKITLPNLHVSTS
jgi:hypothetical protein